ncbi:hypothetical protein [Methylobacterium trifolii]|uniref:hypothetical protein n=1 Tax=Methylobacterium trifolii TaxID=1003092 RepID=UPI001EE1451E|nr:hypothetical protein [Methylobacterium trifolii]
MIILVRKEDAEAERLANIVIEESDDWFDLPKGWRARTDKKYIERTQDHTHLYFRGKQMAVINRDGTSSHSSNLSQIPKHIIKLLKKEGIVEGSIEISGAFMNENIVPREIMDELYETVERLAKIDYMIRGISYRH